MPENGDNPVDLYYQMLLQDIFQKTYEQLSVNPTVYIIGAVDTLSAGILSKLVSFPKESSFYFLVLFQVSLQYTHVFQWEKIHSQPQRRDKSSLQR